MTYIPRAGLNTPAVTVVDESGRVIEAEQRRVFRHLVQNGYGADVLFGVGTTGEWNRLANSERQRVIEIEVDEVRAINRDLSESGRAPVEAWVGVNGSSCAEILSNLDAAIQLGADAAVIAPLAVVDLDEREIVRFFRRDLTDLVESSPREIPILLYDNADIAAPGRVTHIRTRIVKELSRLPWLKGIKVSASRHVLGNYTKAALHFKQPGEFGIYIGNAMLIFEWYRPSSGIVGRLREGWRDYLLHDTLPIGVVSGPANVLPREWQKAWRVCWAGDEEMMDLYYGFCEEFEEICNFDEGSQRVMKSLACLKEALVIDGVISAGLVAKGTRALTEEQKAIFADRYGKLRERIRADSPTLWQSTTETASFHPRNKESNRGHLR
jgi:dihydrodipicolinate synthase/N-acetylneuraminate lyase